LFYNYVECLAKFLDSNKKRLFKCGYKLFDAEVKLKALLNRAFVQF